MASSIGEWRRLPMRERSVVGGRPRHKRPRAGETYSNRSIREAAAADRREIHTHTHRPQSRAKESAGLAKVHFRRCWEGNIILKGNSLSSRTRPRRCCGDGDINATTTTIANDDDGWRRCKETRPPSFLPPPTPPTLLGPPPSAQHSFRRSTFVSH